MYLDYPCRYMYLACMMYPACILDPASQIRTCSQDTFDKNPICIFEVSRMYPSCILELLQIHLSRMYP